MLSPDEFAREHWKDYGAYMERKERIVEVATTLYLAFVSAVLVNERVWIDYAKSLVVLSAITAGLVSWFVVRELSMWSSAATMCNASQTMMTRWMAQTPSPNELSPVKSREFAGVWLPRGLVDELRHRRTRQERWHRRYGKRLWLKRLFGAPFELIVFGLIGVWTVTLWGRVLYTAGMDFTITADEFRALVIAVTRHWVTGMTGLFGLVLTIVGFGMKNGRPGKAFLIVGLFVLFLAPVYAWRDVRRALVAEQLYRSRLADDFEALAQTLYKRVNEWETASLAGNRQLADQKRLEAGAVMEEIDKKLQQDISGARAGYFRRSKPNEPFSRQRISTLPDGNWINEMWHRVDRLEEIIQELRSGQLRRVSPSEHARISAH